VFLEHFHALRPERLGRGQAGQHEDLGEAPGGAFLRRRKQAADVLQHLLLQKAEDLRAALEHRRGEDAGMPALDGHHGLADKGQLVGEKEEPRLARVPLPGGVEDYQVDLLVTRLAAGLHLVLARLTDQKTVLLEILADNAFVYG
jgi:hypothetical protein